MLAEASSDVALGRRQTLLLSAAAATAFSDAAHAETAYPKFVIDTTEGEMQFELWDDVAPNHVKNILTLAKQGFFDGQSFHRIIPGFVIQGGDPNTKIGYAPGGKLETSDKKLLALQARWGTGGPGYQIDAEFNERLHDFGVLSMARGNDVNSAGSQFFVCLGRERCASLDGKYTAFGKIIKGEDVLQKIGAAQTNAKNQPLKRQGINRADPI